MSSLPTHARSSIWPQEDPEHKLCATAILARRLVDSLRELVALRQRGWEADGLDGHFETQRRTADGNQYSQNRYWYKTMKKVMGELDGAARAVRALGPLEFLDVGCAPGGFSAYVLQKNARASGVGISLPAAMGGYDLCLEPRLGARFRFVARDILSYDLGRAEPCDNSLDGDGAFPAELHARFGLVILDGHALRTYTPASAAAGDPPSFAHAAYRDALLVAQFVVALTAVQPGGTVVAKLSHVECHPAAQLVFLLDVLSEALVLHKPRAAHANRGTFYAVARGVGRGRGAAMAEGYLVGLRALWRELRCGGEGGRGRFLGQSDLDFVTTADAILDEHVDRLVELGDGVWQTQVEGLQYFFHRKGIASV
ncbi:hypothetical protein BC628DRAFT_1475255 [Trametes gibbosa]|nr:hypothetical protein BC628DRAFT_1475255 [Trametes gibbosa]